MRKLGEASPARTFVLGRMARENEMVPAVREHPGTRPTPTEGADMKNDTHPVPHAHDEDTEASLAAAERLLRAVREGRMERDTAIAGVRAHLARVEKLGR